MRRVPELGDDEDDASPAACFTRSAALDSHAFAPPSCCACSPLLFSSSERNAVPSSSLASDVLSLLLRIRPIACGISSSSLVRTLWQHGIKILTRLPAALCNDAATTLTPSLQSVCFPCTRDKSLASMNCAFNFMEAEEETNDRDNNAMPM